MVAGNMCCGVLGDDLVVRIDPTLHHDALTRPNVSEFSMGGRTSKGMIRVGPAGVEDDDELALWLRLGIAHATSLPAKKAGAKKKATATKKKAPAKKAKTPAKPNSRSGGGNTSHSRLSTARTGGAAKKVAVKKKASAAKKKAAPVKKRSRK